MSKRQVLMLLGALMIVVFWLPGFPYAIEKALAVVFGVLIIFIAYRLKPEVRKRNGDQQYTYGENRRESTAPQSSAPRTIYPQQSSPQPAAPVPPTTPVNNPIDIKLP